MMVFQSRQQDGRGRAGKLQVLTLDAGVVAWGKFRLSHSVAT